MSQSSPSKALILTPSSNSVASSDEAEFSSHNRSHNRAVLASPISFANAAIKRRQPLCLYSHFLSDDEGEDETPIQDHVGPLYSNNEGNQLHLMPLDGPWHPYLVPTGIVTRCLELSRRTHDTKYSPAAGLHLLFIQSNEIHLLRYYNIFPNPAWSARWDLPEDAAVKGIAQLGSSLGACYRSFYENCRIWLEIAILEYDTKNCITDIAQLLLVLALSNCRAKCPCVYLLRLSSHEVVRRMINGIRELDDQNSPTMAVHLIGILRLLLCSARGAMSEVQESFLNKEETLGATRYTVRVVLGAHDICSEHLDVGRLVQTLSQSRVFAGIDPALKVHQSLERLASVGLVADPIANLGPTLVDNLRLRDMNTFTASLYTIFQQIPALKKPGNETLLFFIWSRNRTEIGTDRVDTYFRSNKALSEDIRKQMLQAQSPGQLVLLVLAATCMQQLVQSSESIPRRSHNLQDFTKYLSSESIQECDLFNLAHALDALIPSSDPIKSLFTCLPPMQPYLDTYYGIELSYFSYRLNFCSNHIEALSITMARAENLFKENGPVEWTTGRQLPLFF